MEDRSNQLKEELQVSVDNYKTQLSVMSEHVASLNVMVTEKNDRIENLMCQLSLKVRGLIRFLCT